QSVRRMYSLPELRSDSGRRWAFCAGADASVSRTRRNEMSAHFMLADCAGVIRGIQAERRGGRPKAEIRSPKEDRRPKSEERTPPGPLPARSSRGEGEEALEDFGPFGRIEIACWRLNRIFSTAMLLAGR